MSRTPIDIEAGASAAKWTSVPTASPHAWAAVGRLTFAAATRKIRTSSVFVLILIVSIALNGCERAGTTTRPHAGMTSVDSPAAVSQTVPEETADETPLLLENEPLLLLDDSSDSKDSDGPVADNSRCFVCHVNYMEEEIAVTHAGANIGCAGCHGPSDAHIADESWASGGNGTAPDIMFPRDRINPACMACHPRDKIDTPQHAVLFAGAAPDKVCTDCHGNHRLPQRRCTWK